MNIKEKLSDLWDDISWYSFRKHCRFLRDMWKGYIVRRHHVIKTRLPVSSWYDTNTRFLYGTMALVTEFIEKEQKISSEEIAKWIDRNTTYSKDVKEILIRTLIEKMIRLKKVKNIEVNWEATDEHRFARSEMIDIYIWWMDYKRRQKEIEQATHDWCQKVTDNGKKDFLKHLNEERTPEEKQMLKNVNDMEIKLQEEEDDIINRFVKIRSYMWV